MRGWPGWVAATMIVACGGTTTTADDPSDITSDPEATPAKERRRLAAPSIESEVGTLDREAVDAAFSAARGSVKTCIEQANQGLPFQVVGGDIEVEVRIKNDGSVRHAFPKDSDIGHRGAERCILEAVAAQPWPKPEGGEEGIARTRYGLDAPAPRPAQPGMSDLGQAGASLGSKLRRCRTQSGTPSLRVTFYVDADGKVMAAGASVGDESGLVAIDCAVEALEGLTFPSPGSYPAKVVVEG